MRAAFSAIAGALILEEHGENVMFDVKSFGVIDKYEKINKYSVVDDWKIIDGSDVQSIRTLAVDTYFCSRIVDLFQFLLTDLDADLSREILCESESILEERHHLRDSILNNLLIAPLLPTIDIKAITSTALSNAFVLSASILDELRQSQPLLRRFVDAWLDLPLSLFEDFSCDKSKLWLKIIEDNMLIKLVNARDSKFFGTSFSLLAFQYENKDTIKSIATISRELSQRIFREKFQIRDIADLQEVGVKEKFEISHDSYIGTIEYKRAITQVDKIVEYVSIGRDRNAKMVLRDLMKSQTKNKNKEHAIKSLCNIAKKCSDLFRPDFELLCLNNALEISNTDSWLLIQYGNCLKNSGKYSDAIEVFSRSCEDNNIVISCTAGVFSSMGDYSKAIDHYKLIQNWENNPDAVIAIADNLRWIGSFDEATLNYNYVLKLADSGDLTFADKIGHAYAGLAEIAKRKEDFSTAKKLYHHIISNHYGDDRKVAFWKLGLGNIYKHEGNLGEAYKYVDEVIESFPFAVEAKYQLASILGLGGREIEALDFLPSGKSKAWRDWLRPYYRGLLLFKLQRYEEAKDNLINGFDENIVSNEERSYLRMAAALWYLKNDNCLEAASKLTDLPGLHDKMSNYFSNILKLHCALLQEDEAQAILIRRELVKFKVVDISLARAVSAINDRNFDLAITLETEALLKLAV